MTTTHERPRRRAAPLFTAMAAASMLAGVVVASPAAALPATAPVSLTDTVDYFDSAYPGLGAGSVFETVTFERFEELLNSDGRFAFLIGGPDDTTTTATINSIQAAATASGVSTIYNFNPKLDGASLDIRTSTHPDVVPLWSRLVSNYLGKDTQTPFTTTANDPYFFVYDKSHTENGVEDRIVAAVTGSVVAADLVDPIAAAAYTAQVTTVLTSVPSLSTRSQAEFYRSTINGKHVAQFPADAGLVGGDILTADDADFRVQNVTYPELINILKSDGDYALFFGGTWCHNTRAVIKELNRQAVANGVKKVYFFDLRLDGASGNSLHIRDTASAFAHLYGDLVNTYLPNLVTQYDAVKGSAGQRVTYFPGGDTTQPRSTAQKLQVPYVFEYNKNRTVAGAAAPIAQQWIRDNGDGTYKEYMTEWWYVLGLNGYITDPVKIATEHAFAAEAIQQLGVFFRALPRETPAVLTVPDAVQAPTVAVTGTSAAVSWRTPADGGSAITGYELSLDGGAPVAVSGPATKYTFTGLAAGTHTVTVTARNAIGASAVSAASATFTVVAPSTPKPVDPTTVEGTITVTGQVRPGGTITVQGSGFAPSVSGFAIELHSTPQLLGTVSTSSTGTFTFTTTIPASVPAGAHSVVVLINGVQVGSASVTVAAATPAAVTSTGLASTGVDSAASLWLAVALLTLGAGGLGVVTARRRSAAASLLTAGETAAQ